MAGFGDFGTVVGEWAAATGESFNHEWYNNAPGEYQARMTRQAQSWKNNLLDAQSQKDAEALRKRLEEEERKYKEEAARHQSDFQRWADLQQQTAQRNYQTLQQQTADLRAAYNRQLEQHKGYIDEQLARQQLKEAEKQLRIGEVGGILSGYEDRVGDTSQQFGGMFGGGGGVYRQELEALTPGFQSALAGLYGTENVDAAQALGEASFQQYQGQAQSLYDQWQNLKSTSESKIQATEAQQQQTANQFYTDLARATAPQYAGLTDDIGLASLGGQISSAYSGLLSGAQSQAISEQAAQANTYANLRSGYENPDAAYASNRDLALDQSQRYGFVPTIYSPNLESIQSQYQGLDPLVQDVLSQYEMTYGGWDDQRVSELSGEVTGQQTSAQQQLAGATGDFAGQVGGLYGSVQGGLLSALDYGTQQAQASSVSQQLANFEQGLLSNISSYYNVFSDYLTKAQTEFSDLKATRLNERQALTAQLAEREAARPKQQMEQAASSQFNKQRQQVSGGGGGSRPQDQLLSLLTRGSY